MKAEKQMPDGNIVVGVNEVEEGLLQMERSAARDVAICCRRLARQVWGPLRAALVFHCAGIGAGTNVVGLGNPLVRK